MVVAIASAALAMIWTFMTVSLNFSGERRAFTGRTLFPGSMAVLEIPQRSIGPDCIFSELNEPAATQHVLRARAVCHETVRLPAASV
ncbi:hypothetical protein VVD49_06230 [Uliginosibacterium sp. H3]|uniref:Secreted protein n=1 Tax=Uliginosibacterium silvisoli TaxID=3114758 RepID=A0ABU6K1L9_9RHOO|nr:hypothetical protein [Uliginosibacterium sp. H3]